MILRTWILGILYGRKSKVDRCLDLFKVCIICNGQFIHKIFFHILIRDGSLCFSCLNKPRKNFENVFWPTTTQKHYEKQWFCGLESCVYYMDENQKSIDVWIFSKCASFVMDNSFTKSFFIYSFVMGHYVFHVLTNPEKILKTFFDLHTSKKTL